MIHPYSGDPSALTVPQIEEKLSELTRKYYQTHNPQLQEQISTFIEIYRQELVMKIAQEQQRQQEQDGENGLDNLINIS
jgi:uncharacterized lipoprotein YddW (UPF0748 family)